MRLRLLFGLVAAFALLAGCGGGSDSEALSADEYRSQLDAECAQTTEELAGLAETQADEGLSVEEAQEEALEIGDGFEERVAALTPPEELSDEHDALVEAFDDPVPGGEDIEESRAYVEESRRLFADLGAEECEEAQQDALDALPAG